MQLECEWDKCSFETTDERKTYNNHVHDHLVPLSKITQFKTRLLLNNWNSILADEQLTCQWNLCKFDTDDRVELLRHLDYHAYHTRLKTFGLGLVNVISIPNCLADSKFRNVIPEIPNDYFCYWDGCLKSFTLIQEFIEHVNYHIVLDYETGRSSSGGASRKLVEIRADCSWDGCDKVLPNVFELKRHLKTHTKEKLIGCANCGSLFTNKPHFINHCIRQVVNRKSIVWWLLNGKLNFYFIERSFQCPDCFKYYPSEKILKDHTRSHINKFQCSICGLSWQKKSILARHIRKSRKLNNFD